MSVAMELVCILCECLIVRYNKSVAQVLIRWSLQNGYTCIPKSINRQRIAENSEVFDFSLSHEDMTEMVSE